MTYPDPGTDVRGMTIALNAGNTSQVLEFYSILFRRGPDTAPMDDFLEWQICPGTWLQLSTGHERPGANNARVRVEVDDITVAVARMQQAHVPMGEVVTVPEVVAFSNFSDHWGNALGFYQLLSPRNIVTEAQRRRDARERSEGHEQEYKQEHDQDNGAASTATRSSSPDGGNERPGLGHLFPETSADTHGD